MSDLDKDVLTKSYFLNTLKGLVEPRVAWETAMAEQLSILQTKIHSQRKQIEQLEDEFSQIKMDMQKSIGVAGKPNGHPSIGEFISRLFGKAR